MGPSNRRPIRLFAPLLVSFLLTACGGGGSSSSGANPTPEPVSQQPAPAPTPAPTPAPPPAPEPGQDTTPPSISSKAPIDQATGVATTAKVVVVFNESLAVASVDEQSLMVTQQAVPVPGQATYQESARTLEFTPESPLAADTVYGITVSSTLQDAAGNTFVGDDWFFTTGGPFNLGATSQSTMDECMNLGDKRMLTLVNDARAVERVCDVQILAAQQPLAWNCRLDQAALGHSTNMANNDFHAHVNPIDGSDPGDRIRDAGYTPLSWGENIAAGYATEDSVMQGWLASPGHCENLMGSGFTELGAGVAENPTSSYGIYWTQNFGRPRD